ncbi:MAG: hypothetical protein BGO01_17070 [Armatimonadetes bacterium 55-13]|nr:hypothetical protein [Armatimonadota bacterium]OJU63868.1 MAG: hypothetical protein BGO01_17070 [Armatimonadetes bacterium 55-13]
MPLLGLLPTLEHQATAFQIRALVVSSTPTLEQKQLLVDEKLDAGKAARWGLVPRSVEKVDYLIERSLWTSPELSNTLAFYGFLESVDMGQPLFIREFPSIFRDQMFATVNPTLARFKREPISAQSSANLRLEWSVTVKDGDNMQTLYVQQTPIPSRGSSRGPIPELEKSSRKEAWALILSTPQAEQTYWKLYRGVYATLNERRKVLEDQVSAAKLKFQERAFGAESMGKDLILDKLPKDVQDQIEQQVNALVAQGRLRKDPQVVNISRSVQISFQSGNFTFATSPEFIFRSK